MVRILFFSALGLSLMLAYNWLPLLSSPPTASAHAFVIGSDPVDGSTINSTPRVMRIFFNEDISPSSIAHIYFGPDAQIMDGGRSTVSSTNPRELDTPLLRPNQLPQGSYTVRWTALSSVDGQATHGVIGFNIGHSSLGLQGEVILGPSTSNILPQLDLQGLLAVAWGWLVMAALMFWLGIVIVEGLILEPVQGASGLSFSHIRKQALPLQWLCLIALLFGEIINLILRATLFNSALGNGGLNLAILGQILVETNYGYLWLARMILIGLALGFLWWTTRGRGVGSRYITPGVGGPRHQPRKRTGHSARRQSFSELRRQATVEQTISKQEPVGEKDEDLIAARMQPKWHTIVWFTLATLILLTLVLSGDAAQLLQPHFSAIVLDLLYLVAQGIWFGGAAYFAFVLLPVLPISEPDHYGQSLVVLLRQFAPLLWAAIGVLLVSGLFLSEAAITSMQQLVTDPYGRALLVKIVLIVFMLIFTGYALLYLRPRLAKQALLLPVVHVDLPARRTRQSALEQTWRNLKRTMNIVSCLGAAVLLCAALMTFFAPPIVFPNVNYAQNSSSSGSSPSAQTKTVGNLSVILQVTPARVDEANTVTVTLRDSSGRPVTNAQVQLDTNMEIMDMGTTHKTISGGNPAYVAVFAKGKGFSMAGPWDIALRIQRPNQQPAQVVFQVVIS
jgi:putative copper export protein/methionine-rich copper-binding protein CopC